MGVDSGEQHGAGRRAVRRRVVIGKSHPFQRQSIERGRVDLAAVGSKVGKTQIIGQHKDNIGPLLGYAYLCPSDLKILGVPPAGRKKKRDSQKCAKR